MMPRSRPVTYAVCLLAVILTVAWPAAPTTTPAGTTEPAAPDESTTARAGEAYGKLPISFVANEGQADERVKFISRGSGYSLSLTPTEAVLVLAGERDKDAGETAAHVLVMRMVGANPSPRLTGLDELPGKVNYLLGSDPSRWRTNVPTFSRVKYQSIYD
ncbi:MAG TPA: hypothetical protein VJT74_09365, partial [Pyrinomonadaceae bacterium]|nr:hypothetical protein [Pyrinomonadaceae bacterium]